MNYVIYTMLYIAHKRLYALHILLHALCVMISVTQTMLSVIHMCALMCHDSSVGVPTRYGLDGLGIETRQGKDFPHLSIPSLGTT